LGVELDGVVTFGAAPERVKFSLGNLCPIFNGFPLGSSEWAIDPDHLEQVLKTKGKWGD